MSGPVVAREPWTATRWVAGVFDMRQGDWEDRVTVVTDAEVRGPFAVHDGRHQPRYSFQPRGRWVLSHIPAGCLIHAFAKRKQAKDAADHMVRIAGGLERWWALSGPEVGHPLRDVARQAIAEVAPADAAARWPEFNRAHPTTAAVPHSASPSSTEPPV